MFRMHWGSNAHWLAALGLGIEARPWEVTMTTTSKREVARILRAEADRIRRHGFTDIFSHQFACVLGQVLRPETCQGCVLADYVPEEYRNEAFPCQHVDRETWMRIVAIPGLREKVADRFVSIAEELEAHAQAEERLEEKPISRPA